MSIGGAGFHVDPEPFEPGSTGPVVRPGPDLMPSDSWEATGAEARVGPQHGYRRDPVRARRWLVLGLVLVALGTVVILPILLTSGGDPPVGAVGAATGSSPDGAGPPGSASDPSLVPATAAMPPTTAPTRDPGSTGPGPIVVPPPANPTRTTTQPPVAPKPPAPITLEAEGPGVTLTGSAFVASYPGASNGMIVRNIGNWDPNPGTLRFNDVVIPVSGRYRLTVFVVHLDNEPTRTAQVTVSGASPVTQTFTATDRCCTATAITLTIAAGTHTITISNATGHAPSVDKIVIGPQ